MRRLRSPVRADWRARCESVGLDFHTIAGEPYWDESAAYAFDLAQVERLEAVVEALHQQCLELVEWVVREGHFEPFGIDGPAAAAIGDSWRRGDPTLYGRFDFSWDGSGEPMLLEYNADTPTGLVEAAVAQWYWLKDVRPRDDQFNSVHERLVERWPAIAPRGTRVHFAVTDGHLEDEATTRYLMDTAMQAGLRCHDLAIDALGFDPRIGDFVDDVDGPVTHLFKLYPWEWMWDEPFAAHLATTAVRFVEPPWKLLLSSKAMLPLLWRRHRGHPNLLPASFDDDLGRPVVRKPRYSREGANIAILDTDGEVLATPGPYAGPAIWQASALLPCFDGRYPVVGAWVVGDAAAGMGIREDASPITRDSSRFVPHYFEAGP